MKLFILIIAFLSIQNLYCQEDEIISLSSHPAFHEGFSLKVNKNQKTISIETHNNFFVSDSISNESFEIMDNERFQKIVEFIPPSNVYSKTLTDKKINQIYSYLEKLTLCKEGDYLRGLDGITFFVSKNKNECSYWSPNKDSEIGKNILSLIKELRLIFNDNLDILKKLNNTRRYIYIPSLEILDYNLPYLKLYRFYDCDDFIKQIEPLKKSDEVFIDITEYFGRNEECIKTELYKKFKHIRWIQNEMFDKFNKIDNDKK